MNWETVKLEGKGPVRHLVLNRPGVHNAINQQLLADLHGACSAIAASTWWSAVVAARRCPPAWPPGA